MTLFILGCTGMSQAAYGSQALECSQVFLGAEARAHSDYQGIALTYAPSLLINGTIRHYPNHVIIETFPPGANLPRSQTVTRYYNPTGLPSPFGREELHRLGLLTIYQNYGDLVDPAIIAKVIKVEESLSLDRQATFLARNSQTGKAAGFIRIFDGSIYFDGVRATTNFALPLEKILKSMNKSTTVVEEFRGQNKQVFEIGKYFISKDLDPTDSKFVKSDIFRFIIDYLETRGEDELKNSYFLAHVASRTHRIAYERFFGFEVAPREKSQGLDANEDLLFIRGDQFLQNLRAMRSGLLLTQ
jgi:hypothetical protein